MRMLGKMCDTFDIKIPLWCVPTKRFLAFICGFKRKNLIFEFVGV